MAGSHRQLVDVMVGRVEVVRTRQRQAANKKTPFQRQQQSSNKGASLVYYSVSQQVVRGYFLLDRQNLSFSTSLVLNGLLNCALFCIVGRQLPNIENHCG